MIRLIAELRCPKHPRYKAMRAPLLKATYCADCWTVWNVVRDIRNYSKRYTLQWSDKVWPRISK